MFGYRLGSGSYQEMLKQVQHDKKYKLRVTKYRICSIPDIPLSLSEAGTKDSMKSNKFSLTKSRSSGSV